MPTCTVCSQRFTNRATCPNCGAPYARKKRPLVIWIAAGLFAVVVICELVADIASIANILAVASGTVKAANGMPVSLMTGVFGAPGSIGLVMSFLALGIAIWGAVAAAFRGAIARIPAIVLILIAALDLFVYLKTATAFPAYYWVGYILPVAALVLLFLPAANRFYWRPKTNRILLPDDGSDVVLRPPQRTNWRKGLEITVLAGPAIVMFLMFVIYPVFSALYYGFFRWNGVGVPSGWAWLQNYYVIFTDPEFLGALQTNGIVVVMSLILQGPAAILLALLLNQKMRGRGIVRVLIFVPYVVSEVIVGLGWSQLLNGNGAANALLKDIGSPFQPQWLSDTNISIWVLMFILTWKYVGFAVILFLAGLQGVPEELSEAAAIDGASYWRTQWHITLPLLGPTVRIWAFLSIIGSLQLFDMVNVVWGKVASIAGVSTMATYMYKYGAASSTWGYGSAVAVVLFLISLVIALLYQRFVLRRDTAGALTEGADE